MIIPFPKSRTILSRLWKRFVDYAKVGICIALLIFLLQTIAGVGGHGGVSVLGLFYAAIFLLGFALTGAAVVAAAHEIRRPRQPQPKEKRDTWRKQVPW